MKLTTIVKPVNLPKDFLSLIDSGDYFSEMDFAIDNSATATMAVSMFKKYCTLENLKPQYNNLWNKIIDEKIRYGMFTLWIGYDANLEVKEIQFRQSKNYRVKKQDDTGKSSLYINVVTKKELPTFNSNKLVLQSQIEKSGGFSKFSGQIFQYNSTSKPYEITPLFSVYNWMKVEFDTPNHVSASADNALFGNNLFIMRESSESKIDDDGNVILTNTDRVVNALKKGKGAKNSGSNFVIKADTEDDLSKLFVSIPIGTVIDVDKFNQVDDKAGKKICTACYCFPQILANPSEGLFGNSGDAYRTAIDFWKATCEFEANKIYDAILNLGIDLQIQVAEKVIETVNVDQSTKDAQSQLKGSVGGVQALLQLQASYSQQLTSYDSAIAILKFIFGFTPEEATELLGSPIVTTTQTPPAV